MRYCNLQCVNLLRMAVGMERLNARERYAKMVSLAVAWSGSICSRLRHDTDN